MDETPITAQPTFTGFVVPLLIVGAAFTLRVAGLDRFDYWFDEVGQILAGRSPGLAEVVAAAGKHYGAAPLDYVLTWAAIRLVGETEFALRYLPLMWSTLAVALMYPLANAVFAGAGKWAAVFVAVSPLAIRYAQEVRFYALGLMLGMVTLTLAALGARGRFKASLPAWLALSAAMTATLYAHVYSALLALAGVALVATLSPSRSRLRLFWWYGSAMAVALCAYAPWLFGGLNARPHPVGTSVLNAEHLNIVLAGLELTDAGGQAITEWPAALYPLTLVALYALAGVAPAAGRYRYRMAGLLLAGSISVGLVIAATLAAHYFFTARQFLFLLPVRALVFAGALAALERRVPAPRAVLKWSVYAALSTLLLVTSTDLVARGYNRAEVSNASAAAEFLAGQIEAAGSHTWFFPAWLSLPVDYYLKKSAGPPVRWRNLEDDLTGLVAGDEADSALRQAPAGAVVVVARMHADIIGRLQAAGFSLAWPDDISDLQPLEYLILLKQAQER